MRSVQFALKKNSKIVIITTGQPSVNPRVVKEANAFSSSGHEVFVLYCFWIDWAHKSDALVLEKVKWIHKRVGGTPFSEKWVYWFTRIQFKVFRILYSLLGNVFNLAELSQARCYKQLLKAAKGIKADWYIGHNLGALSIAVKAAKFNLAKAGFDFEDYHRGENETININNNRRIEYLEKKYLTKLNYISTASPLITKKVSDDFRELSISIITLNNAFSLNNQQRFRTREKDTNSVQLFWFSQTVGPGRGLETVLQALNILNDRAFHLTLVGRYSSEIELKFKSIAGAMSQNIHFIGVVEDDKIAQIATSMDIGLAVEQNTPLNRDICLTNKIFTYLLAGNAIVLTDTQAQKEFQNKYNVGLMYCVNNVEECRLVLNTYRTNRELLNSQRNKNWNLANELLNWESESVKLIEIMN